ncbi:MAG: universal stress protein [Deltaproteobacteria bacterium]|nr:universal stress protein [Deltaproteobacteria bacterium]MBW2020244.1 universal stress protein [Deltaproteobacteria bacterium]MBW2075017.1 universal stress protein [Deltaproteobacteria bacterium]RLB79970.1 MAG: universal stress protein [Deltaproteobacteria bacterium]
MKPQLLHVFRNTPFGRETLLESAYFCKTIDIELVIYIPKTSKFLMYFENDVVQVDLDSSYLTSPETAVEHATSIVRSSGLDPLFFEPKDFTASTLPDIPTHFDYMCCPRSIVDLSSKIGLGYIGPRVRRIVQNAPFPVYIPNPVFKEWKSLAVFFGGSSNAVKALRVGMKISKLSDYPLRVFTQLEGKSKAVYEQVIKENGLEEAVENWTIFDTKDFKEDLYEVPHDALVVVGAYGHGLIKELAFGSKMELIQTVLPNSMLLVGPYCRI